MLGEGCIGKVYRGLNEANGELISIKTINLKSSSEMNNSEQIQNFIEKLQKLNSQNI